MERAGEVDYLITWRDNEFAGRVSLTRVVVRVRIDGLAAQRWGYRGGPGKRPPRPRSGVARWSCPAAAGVPGANRRGRE